MALLAIFAIVFALCPSCTDLPDAAGPRFNLTPTELYQGDALRYKALLGACAGSIDIHVSTGRNLLVAYEVWENGSLSRTPYSMSWDDIQSQGAKPFDGEFLYSLLDLTQDYRGEQLLASSSLAEKAQEPSRQLRGRIDHFPDRAVLTCLPLKNRLTVQSGEEAYAAVLAASPGDKPLPSVKLPQEALVLAPWALAVKLIVLD
ncbi:hypothetical protein [Paenibacillus caseinilyticus]|nr:hypothetical protein [Paenibacillus caseinilyticus]MCZ8520458.1 hypothetical protein [Paenibacillus caseinilyticus]